MADQAANPVRMAEISWPAFKAAMQARTPILIPVGATEQHGPHLPLSTDVLLPTGVAERVAEQVGALVAPPIAYGYKSQARSGGGEAFPGTTSLSLNTLVLLLRDVMISLARHGARRLVLVNGHVENAWAEIEAIDLALTELRRDGISDMEVLRLDFYEFVEMETLHRLFPAGYPGTDLEHASLLETSLMLALHPHLVALDKVPTDGPGQFPLYDRWPEPAGYVPPSGVLARAEGASPEKGEWLLADHVRLIADILMREFDLSQEKTR